MKRTFLRLSGLIIVLITFNCTYANAQVDHIWSIGPELGTNISKYGMDARSSDSKLGLVVGAAVNYSIINKYEFTTKFLFSQKGSSYTVNGVKNTQTLNYLEIPIIGRLFFNHDGRLRPNIFAGPSFGILLDVKNKTGNGDVVAVSGVDRNQFRNFDFGITGGLGLNYRIMNQTRLLLDARYTHGLLDIKDPGTINNKAITVNLGMSFGF